MKLLKSSVGSLWRKAGYFEGVRYFLKGKANFGICPICEKRTMFFERYDWLRDHYLCVFCRSIPRNRALIQVIKSLYPEYYDMKIHESSPSGAASEKLRRECKNYTPTFFYPDISPGNYKNGIRCENLERITFESNSFDLVITQDVLEHIHNPGKALAEIARTLKTGGAHIFTVPYRPSEKTVVRAVETDHGIKYLEEKQYHGNPIDREGSLVVTDWGDNLIDYISVHSKMTTTIYNSVDRSMGIDGEFLDVFVSIKRK